MPPRKKADRKQPTKIFVLDTNVLIHDPTSLFRFEEHDVFLPMMTLEELDNHKKGMTEVAREAGVTRVALYKSLSEEGDPRLTTLLGVMRALGVRLSAEIKPAA